jgi:hypothetical protein
MKVLDFIRPTLEDFFRFAKELDKEFLSYIEREELYEGLKRAQELRERQQEPLKKLYCEWMEKSFRFLIDRWLCFEEPPKNSFLRASGLENARKISLRVLTSFRKVTEVPAEEEQEWKDDESLNEEERELIKYILKNLNELYVYGFATELVTLSYFRGDCGGKGIIIPPDIAVKIFKIETFHLLYIDHLWAIPMVLRLRYLYDKFFDKVHATFSRILSKHLSQAIKKGRSEKHIRLIQTAIAVIKNDPESLTKGEPKSFAEKWLREELRV